MRRGPLPTTGLTTGVVGLLMAAGGNGLVSWALQRIPSGLGALLISMVPFWVALADWLRPRGARPPGHVILGLAIGFTGVALLLNPSDIAGARSLDAVDAGTVIVASLLWAAGSVYSRYAPQPSSHWLSAGMQMLGGGAVLGYLLADETLTRWSLGCSSVVVVGVLLVVSR